MLVILCIFVIRQLLYDLMWRTLDKFFEDVEDNYQRCQNDVNEEGGYAYTSESYF